MLRTASIAAASIVAASVAMAFSGPSRNEDVGPTVAQAQRVAKSLATQLASACPLAEADDQQAFDTCRQSLFRSKRLPMAKLVLWGTEQIGKPVRAMELTEFDSEMWTGLYLSLWMFTGKWQVVYDEVEKKNAILLQTKFRNRLEQGQYPYPFWHSTAKWNDWQAAPSLKIYLDASSNRVFAFLRSKSGERVAGNYPDVAPHAFDGQWRWRAADGVMEPRVTLFDGLYRKDNPHLVDLEQSYQEFANEMRRSTCSGCHVPNNPNKMRRLVLLQTPAHAAAEVERIIKSVRDEKMPYDDWGDPAHLDPALRTALLDYANSLPDGRGESQSLGRRPEAQRRRVERPPRKRSTKQTNKPDAEFRNAAPARESRRRSLLARQGAWPPFDERVT